MKTAGTALHVLVSVPSIPVLQPPAGIFLAATIGVPMRMRVPRRHHRSGEKPLRRVLHGGRRVFSLALMAAVIGCSSRLPNADAPIHSDFLIVIERAADVPPGRLVLKPIPGGWLGKSVDRDLFRSASDGENARIAVEALSGEVDAFARLARSDHSNPGELAHPRDLRMARIGVFYEPAFHSGTSCNNFRTGLKLARPASTMLVYVDRPGTVHGVRYTRPYIVDYQLNFPEAGIYAIALRSEGPVVTQRVVNVAEQMRAIVSRVPCG